MALPNGKTPLRIFHRHTRLKLPPVALQKCARRLYAGEKVLLAQTCTLVLCSDRMIKRLNSVYRSIDRATDVLSFTMDEPDILGEIYISLDRAVVQSRRYGLTLKQEVLRLFIHGFFHLLGHDHKKTPDRLIMEKKEQQYFADL